MAALQLSVPSAMAQEADAEQTPAPAPINVRNAGALSCANLGQIFSQPGGETDKTAVLQWIAGFTTAVSTDRQIVDVVPFVDTLQFVQYVALVCGESPQAQLRDAVIVSINRLEPFWVRQRTDVIEIQDGAARLAFLAEAVAPVQRRLGEFGFAVEVDGVYGSGTGTALSNFMTSQGVQPSLIPDGRALYVLTRPAPPPG
jgi:hypothetical protein